MRNYILLISFLYLSNLGVLSQTVNTEDQLYRLVKTYNEMRDYEDLIVPKDITEKNVEDIQQYSYSVKPLIDSILIFGNPTQKATCNYFKTNFAYELAFVYGMAGKNALAYPVLSSVKSDFEYFSNEGNFPLKYMYDSKNYVINYANFAPTINEYYAGFAEVCSNLNKPEEAIFWAKKSINFSYQDDWFRYISLNKIIENKKKLSQLDAEYLDYIIKTIQTISKLNSTYQITISEYNYPNKTSLIDEFLIVAKTNPALTQNGLKLSEAAKAVGDSYKAESIKCYKLLLADATSSLYYIDEALDFFKTLYYSDYAIFSGADQSKSMAVFKNGTLRMYNMLVSNPDCTYWQRLTGYCSITKLSEEENYAKKKAEDCYKKQQKGARKSYGSSDGNYGLCISAYPFPMIWGNFGGVVQLDLNKIAFSFAATKIGHDRDYQNDFYNPIQSGKEYTDQFGNPLDQEKLYYDGSRMNVTMKLFFEEKNDSKPYFTFNVGRVTKKYEPFLTSIYDRQTLGTIASGTISPSEIKYTAFIGGGSQTMLSDHWMLDIGIGIGISKPTLTVNSPYFKNPDYQFNSYFVQSSQDNKIGMSGFLNISVGYYLFKR